MKKIIIAIIIINFYGCKNTAISSAEGLKVLETIKQCYLGSSGRDTIYIEFATIGDSITGKLSYSHFNQYQSKGSINGKMHGDTLLATYTVNFDNIITKKEVAFLKQDNVIFEGKGNTKVQDGITVYDNTSSLIYSTLIKIQNVHCK